MHKKDSKTSEDHYRPVSILPNNLKIYERFMFKQMSKYFEPFFKKIQCSFRKGFSTHHYFLSKLGNGNGNQQSIVKKDLTHPLRGI